jgi:circadian clock protein KaiB
MASKKTVTATGEYAKTLDRSNQEQYILRLSATGLTQRSLRAITNVKKIRKTYLKGRYELEVIDIANKLRLVKSEEVIAAPTLIKKPPLPLRKLIGDMSDKEKFLVGIDLLPRKS